MANYGEVPSDLKKSIDASDHLYSVASKDWFNLLAEGVTVYSISSTEPFRGREAYRKHFEPMLTSEKRKVNVLSRDVQLMGDRAIVAQTNQVQQGDITANVRQTIIWARQGDGWLIEHIHTTLVGTPVGPRADSLDAVKVLNERIATVASVLGVAQ